MIGAAPAPISAASMNTSWMPPNTRTQPGPTRKGDNPCLLMAPAAARRLEIKQDRPRSTLPRRCAGSGDTE